MNLMEVRSTKIAKEDYLMVFKILSDFYGEVQLTMLARELGVTSATAHKVIRHLEEQGLVRRLGRGAYLLTENGDEIASKMLSKHRILEVFLSILGFNMLESHTYAHELEHVSDVVIDKIYNMLGKPAVCPHGNPILGKPQGIPLSRAYPGRVIVVSIAELKAVLTYLMDNKISLNSEVTVVRRRRGDVVVEVNGKVSLIDSDIASGIYVMEAKR